MGTEVARNRIIERIFIQLTKVLDIYLSERKLPLKNPPCSRKGDQICYFFILKEASTAL